MSGGAGQSAASKEIKGYQTEYAFLAQVEMIGRVWQGFAAL